MAPETFWMKEDQRSISDLRSRGKRISIIFEPELALYTMDKEYLGNEISDLENGFMLIHWGKEKTGILFQPMF